jgi:hypothetical protein
VLLCCKGCAGFVVNATAIIPQTDEALRILFAVRFGVRNRLLNIDFRLRWCVNGSHLSLCAVARFEVPEKRMDTVQATRHEPQHPVAPTLQTRQAWSVSKKYTLASRARHSQGFDHNEWSCLALSITATSSNSIGHMVAAAQKKEAAAVFSANGLPFCLVPVSSAAFGTRFLHRSGSTRTNSNRNRISSTPCRYIASS